MYATDQLLDRNGRVWRGSFVADAGVVKQREVVASADRLDPGLPYLVEALPIDFHCHGVGTVDFADLENIDLSKVEMLLAEEGVQCVLTVYVSEPAFPALLSLLAQYQDAAGTALHYLRGVAIEGPLLTSVGGTPRQGTWIPTRRQWRQLAQFGGAVLRYAVLSPDVRVDPSRMGSPASSQEALATVDEVVETLVGAGVSPAFGHFAKSDPFYSAAAIRRLLGRRGTCERTSANSHRHSF